MYEYNPGLGITLRAGHAGISTFEEESRLDRHSDAFKELYVGGGPTQRRATGRSCEELPGGKLYRQGDWKDSERYDQAGCTKLGAQRTREGIRFGEGTGPLPFVPHGRIENTWCCDPARVEDVFEEWTLSPGYKSRVNIIKVMVGGMILGVGYFAWKNYKERVQTGEDVDFLPEGGLRKGVTYGV